MSTKTSVFEFSLTGQKLTARTGILELMDDLGRAMTVEPDMRMLAGGNPAAVPEMQALIRARVEEFIADGDAYERMLGNYEPPRGGPQFTEALASLLRNELSWDVGPENIAVTSGAQSASFYLFNLLAGRCDGGRQRKVLLAQTPEYIGYADQGLEPDIFTSCRPVIEWPTGRDGGVFKYRVDFSAVGEILRTEDISAIAVSRPTNPTGNVLSDEEIRRLSELAENYDIPLIIDGAYGAPFPNLTYTSMSPHWTPNTILLLSLSKLGLPGTRTGIVVAPEPIADAVTSFTAIVGLANGNLGQQLVLPWIEDGSILELGSKYLRPFYEAKNRLATESMTEYFNAAGVDWSMHASEGAFFHWLWFPNLSITTRKLYERLKSRQVLTVPGEYFFYAIDSDWSHRNECLRINFSAPTQVLREGLQIIAEEVAAVQR